MKNATVCRLNDEGFERTIPVLLLDDVRNLFAPSCGHGNPNISRQFLYPLDFLN
jgi:hypothetical protein